MHLYNGLSPIFDPSILKHSYNIKSIDSDLNSLIIYPIESMNMLEFVSKKGERLTIPFNSISNLKINGNEIEIEFNIPSGLHRIVFEAKSVEEIEKEISTHIKLQNEYWKSIDLQYERDGMKRRSRLYYRAPFLSEGEELLWFDLIKGKNVRYLRALTTFRAILYDFSIHDCARVLLPYVDDMVITNQRRLYRSTRTGIYNGSVGRNFIGNAFGQSFGTSKSVGDVSFISEGRIMLTFTQISDPMGMIQLAKAAKKYLFKSYSYSGSGSVCSNCGNINPSGSHFCNRCGFSLR